MNFKYRLSSWQILSLAGLCHGRSFCWQGKDRFQASLWQKITLQTIYSRKELAVTYLTLELITVLNSAQSFSAKTFGVTMFQNYLYLYLTTKSWWKDCCNL